ncbi:MAG: tRNA (N(6)-L-threonylcarbamoyladenosine(37)-C(2))-methylthiotransferase [Desulfurococcaceae archaeon]
MVKVYIETYGCALNRSDEALMKHILVSRGHEIVDNVDLADVVIINTCIVRQDTELKMISRIKELGHYCVKTSKKLVVAGCMAKTHPYTINIVTPFASLVSPQNAYKIEIPVELSSRVILVNGRRPRDLIGVHLNSRIVQIPIQEGCLSNCSFCITKHARRELVSHSIEAIVNSVKEAVKRGAVEIELTGMDLGTYGVDLYRKRKLPQLLSRIIESVKGNYMLRIGMINPEHMSEMLDELVDVVASSPSIYKFFHIPLQSGSDKMLKVMNRRYTVDEYRYVIKEMKKKIPDVSIATDIIVGHPGEDEDDFEQTLKIIRELEFERVHLAGYSIRPLTLSASMPSLNTRIKKERVKKALEVVEEVGLRARQKYLHRTVRCYVTEKSNTWVARLENYIPVVLKTASNKLDYGTWVHAYIDEITFFDIRGYTS